MDIHQRNSLIEKHLPKIRRIALELHRRFPEFEAEEFVQNAVLEVLRQSQRFQQLEDHRSLSCALLEPGHAEADVVARPPVERMWWGFARPRAYGAMLDLIRKRWPDLNRGDAGELPSSENPEVSLIEREQVRILLERIRRLPPKHRAFARFRIEGRTHAEIARKLGVSLPRVSQIKKMVEEKVA